MFKTVVELGFHLLEFDETMGGTRYFCTGVRSMCS